MNKNAKRIVAIVLALGTISVFQPASRINFSTTKAYADDGTNDETTLESLKLKTSSGSTIKLYSDNDYSNDNKVDSDEIDAGETYYAKTSSSTINIDISGPSSKYVKVFKGTSSSAKGKSISSDISLSSGTNTITVRVYSEKPNTDVRYDDSYENEYIIKIKCTSDSSDTDSSSNSSSDYDEIYLDELEVDGKSISLSKSKTTYTYNVKSDVDEVTIKAVPEDSDYTVTIDEDEVNDDDDYEKDISLNKGENKIEIKIENEDDDEERVYTLSINRGSSETSNNANSTPNTATDISAIKASQWVQVNGRWQYNDAMGNPIKNNWFYDRNYNKNYFLQADGYMATGWLSYNGKWYYLGTDGSMKTGWIIDGGKYYYLYTDGTMAYNTTIGVYKLGSDGAWIR